MTDLVSQTRRWLWDDGSVDHVHITQNAEGMLLRGTHGPYHYWIFANPAAEPQWAKVMQMAGTEIVTRIDLERGPTLWRHKDGEDIPGSAEARDLDLACTAATNTLAIRRMSLGIGEIADLEVLYVPMPGLTPKVTPQRYLRHRGGYTYENPVTGFSARLTLDSDDWIRDYPGVCRSQGG